MEPSEESPPDYESTGDGSLRELNGIPVGTYGIVIRNHISKEDKTIRGYLPPTTVPVTNTKAEIKALERSLEEMEQAPQGSRCVARSDYKALVRWVTRGFPNPKPGPDEEKRGYSERAEMNQVKKRIQNLRRKNIRIRVEHVRGADRKKDHVHAHNLAKEAFEELAAELRRAGRPTPQETILEYSMGLNQD